MSKVLYFDCFSGISGDMALGAMLDAGLPLEDLKGALGSLAVSGFDVSAERVLRAGVSATKFTVHEHGRRPARTMDITRTATCQPSSGSSTSPPSRQPVATARRRCFSGWRRPKPAIHQMPVEQVHLHEVGALDSIIDIVGVVFALEWVGADRIVCSPLNVGGGMVQSAHGLFPVPAPATVKLLGDAPVYAGAVQTGARDADRRADRHRRTRESFGPIPAMSDRARRLRRRRARRSRRRRTCCAS